MAQIQIPNLPVAIALNGTEQLEAVQAGTSVRVTTQQIANLSPTPTYYGSFYDTTTQTNAGATSANPVKFNTTDLSLGVSVESLSTIRIANAGIYNIQFSFQFDKTDSGDDEVEVWLAVNGSNVANSGGILSLHGNNGKDIAAWNYLYPFNANDTFQILWHSADTDMRILYRAAAASPTRPAVPSAILTVYSI